MELSIQRLSKTFNQKPIFRDLSFAVKAGSRFAITGKNGSGKSTLLKIMSGGMLPSSGSVEYYYQGISISPNQVFRYLHVVAPYNTVVEELTLPELFAFHQQLNTLRTYSGYREWVTKLDYRFDPEARIKTFSSGMKQRVKLGVALLDDRPLLLLDEPTSNLDDHG